MRRAVIAVCMLVVAASCGDGESERPKGLGSSPAGTPGSSPAGTPGSSPAGTLNTIGLERELEEQIESQAGSIALVDCPADIEIESGGTFDCTADVESGGTLTIRVTQRDAQGNLEWEVTDAET